MNKNILSFLLMMLLTIVCIHLVDAQHRWQQKAHYQMDIDFDTEKHQFDGHQRLTYVNNSPDTLYKAFYHLYFNAFQPNSMMDVRSRTIEDPDRRVGSRIQGLSEGEIGFQQVLSLTQNGVPCTFTTVGTILEVELPRPIAPGEITLFEMKWKAQVPKQIRRSGRDNAEGIAYSMAQWYPKMAEYDYQGWHSNPYIGREFHGIWGNYEVNITIDKDYVVAAGAILQNPSEIGYGYSDEEGLSSTVEGKKITYRFLAENVHDFMWAADPDYTHTKIMSDAGTELHFFFQENEKTKENWENLPKVMNEAQKFINANYGEYPYPVYYFIQGGDGGMEYPMGTLITGERSFGSLVCVSIHEWMHSWYQMVLGSNEALYSWMDEGFTSYASAAVGNYLRAEGVLPGDAVDNPHANSVKGFARWLQADIEEPLTTHSDHFVRNQAYSVAAYTKGSLFLTQMEYIIGEKAFKRGLLNLFDTWKFRHPNDNDVTRIFEKSSGLELDWYNEYWVKTTKHTDYAIDTVFATDNGTKIVLKKLGLMPMPLDVYVETQDGNSVIYNIPLVMMRGDKSGNTNLDLRVKDDWPWVNPNYELHISENIENINSITIDKRVLMVDTNRDNNVWLNE